MFESLKSYKPSVKGRELIAVLFPLTSVDRGKNMLAYWKRYPNELNTLLDGFHFIVQELIETRNSDKTQDVLGLSDDILYTIFKQMHAENNYFSYDTGFAFFDAVNISQPPIFADSQKARLMLENASNAVSESVLTTPELPEKIDDTLQKQITDICDEAVAAYNGVLRLFPAIRRSRKIIRELNNTQDKIALIDLCIAEETFKESLRNFQRYAKTIADGMAFINSLYQKYQNNIFILQIYQTYLAKVLASRESILPTEGYVSQLAKSEFKMKESNFEPSKEQLEKGITSVSLRNEYKTKLMIHINRLECRYQKRKLMVQLKDGKSKLEIIQKLIKLTKIDPDDIKTGIFLGRLLGEHAKSMRDPIKRRYLREEALKYCQIAFSGIDVYLNLQGIKNVRERDIQRAGFSKTISSIRIPLIQNK